MNMDSASGDAVSVDDELFCGPCEIKEKNSSAVHWCMACGEGLCVGCFDHHRAIKTSRHHSTITVDDIRTLQPFVSSLETECKIHGVPLDLYCPCHDTPCCSKCVSLIHSKCVGITGLSTYVEDSKKCAHLIDLETKIDVLLENIEASIRNRTNIIDKCDPNITIDSVFSELEKEIGRYLKTLKQKLNEKHRDIMTKNKSEMNKILERLNDKKRTITECKNNLTRLKNSATDVQVFLGCKKIEVVREYEVLNDMTKEPSMQDIEVEMVRSDKLEEIISAIADIKMRRNIPRLTLKEFPEDASCQIVTPTPQEHVTFDTSCFNDQSNITSIIMLHTRHIVASDYTLGQFVIFHVDGLLWKTVSLSDKPFGLTVIDEHKFAASFPAIRQIKIFSQNNLSVLTTFSVNGQCWGLQFIENVLIIAIRGKEILTYDLSGYILNSLPMKVPNLIYIHKHKDKINRSQLDDGSVYCYDMKGNNLGHYKSTNALGTRNMCSDAEGNLFLACQDSNQVIAVSNDGNRSKLVVEIESPKSIYFELETSILYVCSLHGNKLVSYKISNLF